MWIVLVFLYVYLISRPVENPEWDGKGSLEQED